MASSSIHPAHCCGDCSEGAGPSSNPSMMIGRNSRKITSRSSDKRWLGRKANSKIRNAFIGAAAIMASLHSPSSVNATPTNANPSFVNGIEVRDMTNGKPESLSTLLHRRKEWLERDYTAMANLESFSVDVTQPQSCQPIQITWSTLGGMPPFTVFLGFDDWYSYSASIPSTYADPDVTTWLYEFNVPNFINTNLSSATPEMFVIVGDSSGKLLNTSSFQTVQTSSAGCPLASVPLDFTFWTSPNSDVCTDIQVNWQSMSNTTITYKAPLDLYLIPQQQPPIHIPIANASAQTINTTLAIQPGTSYMFAMTDATGIGGVSGNNIVGLNEYLTGDCLSQNNASHALPAATTTLASVRMPDFTGVVSSLVTSNGVVSTATSIQVIDDGSLHQDGFSTVQIIGLAIGCAIGAGLIAALVSWYIWRKRHGRKTFSWDLPRGMYGEEIEKTTLNAPIDRNYLQTINSPPSSVANSNRNTALTLLSPPRSEASEDPERNRGGVHSDGSSRIHVHTGQGSGTWNPLGHSSYQSSGSARYNSVPSAEQPDSPTGSGSGSNNGSNVVRPASLSSQTPLSGTYNSHYVPNSSARGYIPAERNFQASSLPMIDTRRMGNGSSQGQANSPNSSNGEHRFSGSAQIVQHSDAGLLMDDSLDDEEMMGRIELPPSYHQISRPGNRDSAPRRSSRLRESETGMRSTDSPGPAAANSVNEDDREFWLADPTSTQRN